MKQKANGELFTRVWNSSFIRIILYALLCQLTMAITNTVLPLYVMNGLGHTAAESGMLGTAFTIGSMACRFVSGYISDRFGRRVSLMLGACIIAVSMFCMGFTAAVGMLLVYKVIQGIGNAISSTASNATASEVLPRDKVGQGIGYYSLHTTVTNAMGPTICLALMAVGVAAASDTQNYRLPLLVAGGMGVAAMLIALTMNYEKPLKQLHPELVRKPSKLKLSDFLERRAMVPAIMIFFTAFASGAGVYMIVFASEYQFKTVSLYYILNAVIGVLFRFALGSRLDKLKPRYIAIIAIALNVISYLMLGLTLSEWAFLVSAVLLAIYNAMLMPTFNAMALKLSPESRSGAASTTYWLGFDIGMAIGMLVFGYIIDWGSYPAAFLISAGYMLVFGIIVFFALHKTKPLSEIESPVD